MFLDQIYHYSNLLEKAEKIIRNATKNNSKDPTHQQLTAIVDLANNNQENTIVLKVLWVGLRRKRKKYLSVYKNLLVVEYLLINGQDTLIPKFEDFKPQIKKLRSFKSARWRKDKGEIVRKKSQEVWKLITNHTLLLEKREAREEYLLNSLEIQTTHTNRSKPKSKKKAKNNNKKNKKKSKKKIPNKKKPKKCIEKKSLIINSQINNNEEDDIENYFKKKPKRKKKFFKFF
ncbi:epsin/ent-related [Anaeramoeba flamelloides]|uniref:Epsin/ent-related n=1 Tax=Anaeramoeba flamelloides TaxID=1746091 RepID=A0AAV7ZVN2_9EUKA|nr:epsin/ent-related [Anaeramoeba flamelloides]